MRCGVCSHQWHVERTVDMGEAAPAPEPAPIMTPEPAPAAATSTAPATNVPALTEKPVNLRPLMIAAPILALLWFAFAFVSHASRWVDAPVIGGMYRLFGATSTKGLAFAELKMEREEEESKTRFILSGKIVNHAPVERIVPIVRVLLKDKDGGEVWARKYPVNIALKPGEDYPFRIVNVETSFGEKVETVVIDLGNSMELMLR